MSVHDRACMSYWWPKVRGTSFYTPQTELVEWGGDPLRLLLSGEDVKGWERLVDHIRGSAEAVGGFPVFLRTGLLSGKHGWKRTCHVPDADSVPKHIAALVEEQEMAFTLPEVRWFAIREMLDLDTRFHAFHGEMPVNVEFRAFADQESCRCIHPYWPMDAIRSPSVDDWRGRLTEIHAIDSDDRDMMRESSASLVADRFDGSWSVDWARHSNGRWYLIDMAPAGLSHHPDGCPEAKRFPDPRKATNA